MIRAIGLDAEDVVCAARDRASANSVAIETMQAAYKNMLDVNCISHTLNDVGTNIKQVGSTSEASNKNTPSPRQILVLLGSIHFSPGAAVQQTARAR